MSNPDVPSLHEVNAILNGLKTKIVDLLDEHVEMVPPYTPNYMGFIEDLGKLADPVARYSDAAFHQGEPDPGPFLSFVRIVAELKLETQNNWLRANRNLGTNHRRSIRYYGHFKMLMRWFGYGSDSPWAKLQIYDLLYQIEQSKNEREQEVLIAELRKITGSTSTASYLVALEAFRNRDFQKALSECDESIRQFPENTSAYQLKSKILHAMATEALQSGLALEPRDAGLKESLALVQTTEKLRARFRNGDLSFDTFASEIEDFCARIGRERPDALAAYAVEIAQTLPGLSSFPAEVTTFLCTGEYLLDRLPAEYDHAAAAIEFCKAIEVSTFHKIFQPFREEISVENLGQFPKTEYNAKLLKFCAGRAKLTIGDMAFVIQISGSLRKKADDPLIAKLDEHLHASEETSFVSNLRLALKTEHIDKYRNSAAHDGVYSLQKAKEASMWAYGCLKTIASFSKP